MVNSPKLFFILLNVNHFEGVGKGLTTINEENYDEVFFQMGSSTVNGDERNCLQFHDYFDNRDVFKT